MGSSHSVSERAAISTLVSVFAIILIGLTAVLAGRASLRAAEDQRLTERSVLVKHLGEYISSTYDPRLLAAAARRTSFP